MENNHTNLMELKLILNQKNCICLEWIYVFFWNHLSLKWKICLDSPRDFFFLLWEERCRLPCKEIKIAFPVHWSLTSTCWYCWAVKSFVPTGAIDTKPFSCSPLEKRNGMEYRPLIDELIKMGFWRPSSLKTCSRKEMRPFAVPTEFERGELP